MYLTFKIIHHFSCDGEFFLEDVGLITIPDGDWFCIECDHTHTSKNTNAKNMNTKKSTKMSSTTTNTTIVTSAIKGRKRSADVIDDSIEKSDVQARSRRNAKIR